jgi:hypothetical protein
MNVFKKTVTLAAAVSLVCLSSAGAMAASKLIVKDSTGVTDKFVVTDSGFLGIGAAPASALDIKGTLGADAQMRDQYTGTTATSSPGLLFLRNNPSGTSSLPLNNDRLGFFGFGAMNGAATAASSAIIAYAAANWSLTSMPSFYTFEVTPVGATTRAEAMRIVSTGNIGIGTAGPSQKLEVNGGFRLNTTTAIPTCSTTTRGVIWYTRAAVGVADTLQVCSKDASENYAWHPLF